MNTGAVFYLLLAALCFSTGGAAIKATELTSWQVAAGRSAIAGVFLLLALPAARRAWNGRTVVVGLAYAGTVLCFVHANKLTTAASAIFLQSTAPLYLLVLQPLLLREPVRRVELLFAPFFGLGMLLFFVGTDPVSQTAPNPVAGNLVAALSGVFWALTLIGLRSLSRDEVAESSMAVDRGVALPAVASPSGLVGAKRPTSNSSLAAVVAGNLFAVLVALPFALSGGWPEGGLGPELLPLSYLGVVQIGLAYLFMTFGLRRATAMEAGLLLLLEPVLNPVWAALFHDERLSAWSLLGGAIILAATTVRVLAGTRRTVRGAV